MNKKQMLEVAKDQSKNVYNKVKDLLREDSTIEAENILIKSINNEY